MISEISAREFVNMVFPIDFSILSYSRYRRFKKIAKWAHQWSHLAQEEASGIAWQYQAQIMPLMQEKDKSL